MEEVSEKHFEIIFIENFNYKKIKIFLFYKYYINIITFVPVECSIKRFTPLNNIVFIILE